MADGERREPGWPDPASRRSRIGLTWGSVYLVFLAYPVIHLATTARPAWQIAVAAVALAAFVAVYLRLVSLRRLMRPQDARSTVRPLRYALVLVVLAVVMALVFGENFAEL